jgi:hypothetical protein
MSVGITESLFLNEHPAFDEALSEMRSRCAGYQEFIETLLDEMDQFRNNAQRQVGADQRQIADLDQQRTALESELELIRRRSAEMAETQERQNREIVEERAQWSAELKELRRLLQTQGQLLAERLDASDQPAPVSTAPTPPTPTATAPTAAAVETPPPAADPVVDSVMAQFAKLQQDVKKRRSK